jgi:hypothetical protein
MNVTVNIIFLSIKCCSFLFLEYHSRILRTYWATEHSVFLSESTFETFTSDTSMLSSIHMYVKHMFFFYLSLISKLFVNIDASDFDCYKMLYWSCDIVWGSIALLAAQNLLSQQILERFTYLPLQSYYNEKLWKLRINLVCTLSLITCSRALH